MGVIEWFRKGIDISKATSSLGSGESEKNIEPRMDQTTSGESNETIQFRSYDHGFFNGVLEVPGSHFSNFTEEFFKQALIESQISRTEKEISVLSNEISFGEKEILEIRLRKLELQKKIQRFQIRKAYLDQTIQKLNSRLMLAKDHLVEIKEKYFSDYTLFPAILFLLAGILFIIADYGLALTIIGDALKIGIETKEIDGEIQAVPTYITYLFAAALAALSFAIKPAYDRIIEKKLPNPAAIKKFNWSILIVAVLVLFMLFAMGMFREVVIGEGLRSQMNSEALEDSSEMSVDIFANEENIPNRVDPENGMTETENQGSPLIHNVWALISIVLSTCLFALTGAICMGIAIPVIHRNSRIVFNYLMQFNYRRRMFLTNNRLFPVNRRFEEINLEIAHQEVMLEEKLKIREKTLLLLELRSKSEQLLKEYFRIRTDRANAIYLDGYERGKILKDQLPPEWAKEQILIFSNINEDGRVYRSEQNLIPEESQKENGELARTRPFIAVRKMISGRFRRKFFDGPESTMEIK